jgi:hypothetical protein
MKISETTLTRTGGAASANPSGNNMTQRVGRLPASTVASPETGARRRAEEGPYGI